MSLWGVFLAALGVVFGFLWATLGMGWAAAEALCFVAGFYPLVLSWRMLRALNMPCQPDRIQPVTAVDDEAQYRRSPACEGAHLSAAVPPAGQRDRHEGPLSAPGLGHPEQIGCRSMDRMPSAQELLSVAAAAKELGITPDAVRSAILRGRITPMRLDGRTNLIPRAQVDKYRAERRGRPGRPAETDKQQHCKPLVPDLLTVAEAAAALGLSPITIRGAIRRKTLVAVELDKRTLLIPREEVERYSRERRGRHGKRPCTENAPKHQECPRA